MSSLPDSLDPTLRDWINKANQNVEPYAGLNSDKGVWIAFATCEGDSARRVTADLRDAGFLVWRACSVESRRRHAKIKVTLDANHLGYHVPEVHRMEDASHFRIEIELPPWSAGTLAKSYPHSVRVQASGSGYTRVTSEMLGKSMVSQFTVSQSRPDRLQLPSSPPELPSPPENPVANAALTTPDPSGVDVPARTSSGSPEERFSVAFSFAGEKRDYVKRVMYALRTRVPRDQILYDKYLEEEFSGRDGSVYLPRVYESSKLIAVFLCADYQSKEWCGVEMRAIRDIMKRRGPQDIMVLRFDDTRIEGFLSTDMYTDLRGGERDPEEVADHIWTRLNGSYR